MPDDIAKIGLDTAEIARAIDGLSDKLDKLANKHAKETDTRFKQLKKTLDNAGKAALAFFGFQGIKAGIQSIIRLNADIDATRSKLSRGSKDAVDFEAAVKGIGTNQANVFHQAERALDNLSLKVKSFLAKSFLGLGMLSHSLFGVGVNPEDVKRQTNNTGNSRILEQEDKIAEAQENRNASENDRIKLLEMEGELLLRQLDYYRRAENMDAEKINSLKAQIAENGFAVNAARTAFDVSEKLANITRQTIEAQRKGYPLIGAAQKIMAEYEERITVAHREGRKELELSKRRQRTLEKLRRLAEMLGVRLDCLIAMLDVTRLGIGNFSGARNQEL